MTAAARPPGPKGKPFVGNLLDFRRDRIGFFMKLAREYGDVAAFKIAGNEALFVNHPDYIKDVLITHAADFVGGRGHQSLKRIVGNGLLTSEGDFHRRQRRLAQPAFHRQRISAYGATMTEYAERARERWRDGEPLDISEEMMRLTLGIVGKTLFDAETESEAHEIGMAITDVFEQIVWSLAVPFGEHLDKLPLPSSRRLQKARARLDATIYRIIEERRASGVDRGDLLSMLLLAQDEEEGSGGMTDEQVRDEAMTLFLAGHETTANALTWSWYLLSEHPEVERRVHEEVDSVLGGRLPTVEDIPRLRYVEQVFAESMRLRPPVWGLGRRAVKECQFGPYTAKPNSIVFISQYVMHHDARYWPDPDRFDPDRWTPEAKASRPRFCYFPFGGGVRQCIGEGFAWMEGVLLMATIAQRWSMRVVPGHPIELEPLITLRPKHGIKMVMRRRGPERGPG